MTRLEQLLTDQRNIKKNADAEIITEVINAIKQDKAANLVRLLGMVSPDHEFYPLILALAEKA